MPLNDFHFINPNSIGLPWWPRWLRICLQCTRSEFVPRVGKIPWRREQPPTLVFLPGKSHGQRSLVGYSLQGHKRVEHDLANKQQQINNSQHIESRLIFASTMQLYRTGGFFTPKRGLPGGSAGKESACHVGDLGLIPGLGRYPGGGYGNPTQYSCLENSHGQRSLAG